MNPKPLPGWGLGAWEEEGLVLGLRVGDKAPPAELYRHGRENGNYCSGFGSSGNALEGKLMFQITAPKKLSKLMGANTVFV